MRRFGVLICVLCGCSPILKTMRGWGQPDVPNLHAEVGWVRLHQQMCTGRRGFSDAECDDYEVTVFTDGRVSWEGFQHVRVEDTREYTISADAAKRLLERTTRAAKRLEGLECAVDHTHYVTIQLAQPGDPAARNYRGCGHRYQRAAAPIDRAANTAAFR